MWLRIKGLPGRENAFKLFQRKCDTDGYSVPAFNTFLSCYIRWLSLHEWRILPDTWPKIEGAVGTIDATSHET